MRPIPFFLRLGRLLVCVKYDGQKPTCRKCGENVEKMIILLAHVTLLFVATVKESAMKWVNAHTGNDAVFVGKGHIGKYSQVSWACGTIVAETTDEVEDAIVDDQSQSSLPAEELALSTAIPIRCDVQDVPLAGNQTFDRLSIISDDSSVLSTDANDISPDFEATPNPEVTPSQQSSFAQQNTTINNLAHLCIPGNLYFHCRGLFLQHSFGDFTKTKAFAHKVSDKEQSCWEFSAGTIRQDAFALLQEYNAMKNNLLF